MSNNDRVMALMGPHVGKEVLISFPDVVVTAKLVAIINNDYVTASKNNGVALEFIDAELSYTND